MTSISGNNRILQENKQKIMLRIPVENQQLCILGCFKSAKNLIIQKLQHFRADSDYMGKINTKKKKSNFFFNV